LPSATRTWPRAERIRHLLPPRLGGVGALLDDAPEADIVVIAHHGLHGLRLISDAWPGGLVRVVVRVRVTRVPRCALPEAGAARTDWRYELWQDVDDWLEEQFAGAAARIPAWHRGPAGCRGRGHLGAGHRAVGRERRRA
jgi:hypothetical protein